MCVPNEITFKLYTLDFNKCRRMHTFVCLKHTNVMSVVGILQSTPGKYLSVCETNYNE